MAVSRNCRAIIQNASGGQVAGFVRYFASVKNIKVIEIARKKETADQLRSKGIENVLYEQSEDFDGQLKSLARQLDATMAFDAVGGINSAKILHSMPDGSLLLVYGALSGKNLSEIDFMDIIFKNKSITGFNLVKWKEELPKGDFERIADHIQELIILEKIRTNIQAIFEIDNIVEGLKKYIGNMSSGKVLLKP
jgi:NADPH:quinone reductase-like Zn-dependent oxidoreductase